MKHLLACAALSVLIMSLDAPGAAAQSCNPPPFPPPDYCNLDDGNIVVTWVSTAVPMNLTWLPEHGFDNFNIYRGQLHTLADANHDGVLDSYGGCLYEHTNDTYLEADVPPVGDAFIYIVSGLAGPSEGDFGVAGNGLARPNAFPCAGTPGHPQIDSPSLVQEAAGGVSTCDETAVFKGFLCQNGIMADQFVAFPTVTIQVTTPEARLEAHVTDPQGAGDLARVSDRYFVNLPDPLPDYLSDTLEDDGAASIITTWSQRSIHEEACSADPVCPVCSRTSYGVTSHDTVSGDDIYSYSYALLTSTIPLDSPTGIQATASLAVDCVAAHHVIPLFTSRSLGDVVQFTVEARDRSGLYTAADVPGGMTIEQTHFTCSGDDCACCILLSNNPTVDCHLRPGMAGVPGSGFENGLCVAIY